MSDEPTLSEIARAIVRIEVAIENLRSKTVSKEVFDLTHDEIKNRIEKVEAWLQWGTRIVIGAAITAVLSYAWVSK